MFTSHRRQILSISIGFISFGFLGLNGSSYLFAQQNSGRFLVNSISGKCIDVKGAPGYENRAELQLWDCEFSGRGPSGSITDQKWEFVEANDGNFLIRNTYSNKCIDVKGAPGLDDRDILQLWDCEFDGRGPNGSISDQKWMWINGFIRNSLSGKCIDVKGSPGVNNNDPLQLWNCEFDGQGSNGSPTDQRWQFQRVIFE
jgi:hypothetical protein